MIRLEAIQIGEIETPRPHYRIQLTSLLTDRCIGDPTAGLIPDEILVVVHLPIDVGTDLRVIRQAAIDHALGHVRMLLEDD